MPSSFQGHILSSGPHASLGMSPHHAVFYKFTSVPGLEVGLRIQTRGQQGRRCGVCVCCSLRELSLCQSYSVTPMLGGRGFKTDLPSQAVWRGGGEAGHRTRWGSGGRMLFGSARDGCLVLASMMICGVGLAVSRLPKDPRQPLAPNLPSSMPPCPHI